jgi:hypothetical protein
MTIITPARKPVTVAVAAASALTAGCAATRGADGSQEPVAAATVTVARITAPPATGTTAPEPTFTSTPTVLTGISLATAVPVGTKLVKDDDDGSPTGTVTVHVVRQWIPNSNGPSMFDDPGVAGDVEVSFSDTARIIAGSSVTTDRWTAVDPEHHVYRAAVIGGPDPAYPDLQPIRAGDSVRGWILLPTTSKTSDLTIRYELTDGHFFWKSS